MAGNKIVDDYVASSSQWRAKLEKLRKILTAAGLEETVKWGGPCYMYQGKNVVGIGAFKSYVGLWFFQGALLSDPDKVLINAQSGKTRAMRQWRFQSARDIKTAKVRAYVKEAIANAAGGKEIAPLRRKPLTIPDELAAALAKNARAKTAFTALTTGKKREYAEYVASAKRATTKASRIEKIMPMIAAGKGLNDKYR